MISMRSLLSAMSLLALATGASGQSFNIDCGDDSGTPGFSAGTPSNTYGAAASSPGLWNTSTFALNWVVLGGVKDLSGATTTVTTSAVQIGNSVGNFYFNNAATSGEDEKLLDDCMDIGNGGTVPQSEATWTFSGLNNGCYEIYVYSWAPDSAAFVTLIEAPNSPSGSGGTVVGGAYTGTLVRGAQYARFTTSVTTNTVTIRVTSNALGGNFGSVNGFQFVANSSGCFAGTGFCSGDGTATACPCANTGAPGNGCASSVNAAGGFLGAVGNTSVAGDTVILQGSGMPSSSCLYFQGTSQQNGGLGSGFGDGLRCAGGTVTRLATKTNVGGSSQYPGVGDLPVSVKGGVPAGGGTRTYQCWYRNAAAFCTPATFNLTNGREIVWSP